MHTQLANTGESLYVSYSIERPISPRKASVELATAESYDRVIDATAAKTPDPGQRAERKDGCRWLYFLSSPSVAAAAKVGDLWTRLKLLKTTTTVEAAVGFRRSDTMRWGYRRRRAPSLLCSSGGSKQQQVS